MFVSTQGPDSIEVEEDGILLPAEKLKIVCVKPRRPDGSGEEWDQTFDAANNMVYAAGLKIPHLAIEPLKTGRAIIVGGGPSVEGELENIRKFAEDKNNQVFALNWAHTWLIQHGIIPNACTFFEIDVDPCKIMENAHPDVTYYICSHCHRQTFDGLEGYKRVLWHTTPNSDVEAEMFEKYYRNEVRVGGGISTFLRTISVCLALGYRTFELFGIDSSFPDDAKTTHVGGYPTIVSVDVDAVYVHARDEKSGVVRRFKTVSYLAHQVEEFKKYCELNHPLFRMRVHGDTLLAFVHKCMWAHQYEDTNAAA